MLGSAATGLLNVDIHMESTANRHNTQKSYKYEGLQDVLLIFRVSLMFFLFATNTESTSDSFSLYETVCHAMEDGTQLENGQKHRKFKQFLLVFLFVFFFFVSYELQLHVFTYVNAYECVSQGAKNYGKSI